MGGNNWERMRTAGTSIRGRKRLDEGRWLTGSLVFRV